MLEQGLESIQDWLAVHTPTFFTPYVRVLEDSVTDFVISHKYGISFHIDSNNMSHGRRLQQDAPAWVTFVVVMGLGAILWWLLRLLRTISDNWKRMMKERIENALKMRKMVNDPFRNTNGYSWDYVMVFQVYDGEKQIAKKKLSTEQEKFSLRFIIDSLAEAGLQTKMFYSVQRDEVYVKIRASMTRLMREADRLNYKLQLEPTILASKLRMGHLRGPPERQWNPVEIPYNSTETTLDPYDYIYFDYRYETSGGEDADEKLGDIYRKYGTSIFRGVDRLKLIKSIISSRRSDGGADLDIYKLIKDSCMLTYFPLHDAVELREVEERWLRMCQLPWKQHVDDVRTYFGEKIGMFFLFLGHYTTWLLSAGIIGFLAWVWVAADDNNPNAAVIPYFAAFIGIWSTLLLEFWKRKEKTHAMKWGMVGAEEEEPTRPQFEGELVVNPVNGQPMRYFPRREFYFRLCFSTNVISVLVGVVIAAVAGIFALRIFLSRLRQLTFGGMQWGSTITALINAVQIQVLNWVYNSIAIYLTEYENHRTDTEYEDALIAKTFIFQFVNSFASLFYISFVKPFIPDIDPCGNGDCMAELQASLGTIFLTRLATGSILKVLMPWYAQKAKAKNEMKGVSMDELTDVELAYIQDEYHVMLGPFQDYANLAIQFGYATMFISAYPLATTLAFVTNYVELRVDAWRLCQQCRRPEPRQCEDIGTWYTIFEIVAYAAVLVNAALVAFTGTNAVNETWPARVWIFFGISAGIMYIKYTIAEYIPDIPHEVEVQLKRQEYYHDKLIDNIPDEDNAALVSNLKVNNKYVVRVNDDDPL